MILCAQGLLSVSHCGAFVAKRCVQDRHQGSESGKGGEENESPKQESARTKETVWAARRRRGAEHASQT
ncbi:hypothetical protein CesoFtcFv8_024996 [Champsocephalus esox]|uniref:Uncharacterized protein n=1 Tax=Champsocephalus esox TaxID=159716 RepID=A0AAN8B311_9TELE|nr:hypothetical protein CesoFtcFv8_024996 [Champsocephalus esox]